uniref:Uncharacterized protein n=1 Tax=Plectus sambesii TaxID=2011161 RepID=A0A914VQC2_9BILA
MSANTLQQPCNNVNGTRQSPINLCKTVVMHDPVLKAQEVTVNYKLGDCTDIAIHGYGWTVNVKHECESSG